MTRILRQHPRAGSTELCARLNGINRATLTRALKTLGDAVIIGGESRRTRYALRRPLRGNAAPIPLYRIDEHGQGREIGQLSLTYPEGCLLSFQETFPWPLDRGMSDGWFEGLPYALADMRPQGFLGRNFAHARALDLGVSDNPDDWPDDDVVHVLATTGYDQPGDLILGEMAYRRFLDYRRTGEGRFLAESAVEASYLQSAEYAMRHGDAGSSAGGEFPKFTASRRLNGKKVDVIVKFSGADESPAVRRWSDLLVCEHLASLTMPRKLQVPSADSAIYQYGGRTFLQVVRFDRHGDFGRSPVCTLGSLNAALTGTAGGNWPKTVRMLQAAGWLSETDTGALIWWFGKLIGNTDMHDANLAFRPGLALAPAYDMLPMAYAPMRGGELPNREFSPDLPLPAEVPIWTQAAEAAVYFWNLCAEDTRISADFRRVCDDNGRNMAALLSRTQ
ncbi:MAG: type II toxin-antitoxin system HipA family toxin YjjJ [Betaproteobacteria bacterium]|nr:type II toxin-antitoxin system HipA family toxin YjjJ [Betaproteobacteria bacterium]